MAQVAHRYGISTADLASANGLRTKSKLHKGQMLRVPNADPTSLAFRPSTSHVSSRKHHTASNGDVFGGTRTVRIKKGDTLEEIAERHNTDVRTLRALNDLRPHEHIRAGGTLKVPVQG
jgi:LysM repeat protein